MPAMNVEPGTTGASGVVSAAGQMRASHAVCDPEPGVVTHDTVGDRSPAAVVSVTATVGAVRAMNVALVGAGDGPPASVVIGCHS